MCPWECPNKSPPQNSNQQDKKVLKYTKYGHGPTVKFFRPLQRFRLLVQAVLHAMSLKDQRLKDGLPIHRWVQQSHGPYYKRRSSAAAAPSRLWRHGAAPRRPWRLSLLSFALRNASAVPTPSSGAQAGRAAYRNPQGVVEYKSKWRTITNNG